MSLDTHTNGTNEDNGANKTNFFTRHKILTGLLIAIVAIIGWWKYEFPSATWRYKMTVTVETPEGIKTGSAVREVHVRTEPKILPEQSPIHYSVKGEAVTVDLGNNRYLFYTMATDHAFLVLSCAYGVDMYSFEAIKYYSELKANRVSLLDKKCLASSFVTFKDIKDPETVIKVDPNNLSEPLGVGVNLKDITIEMTDEQVTWDVGKYLDWLDRLENSKARLNGSTSIAISTNELSDNLGSGSFRIRR
jgi:hypothetical protein